MSIRSVFRRSLLSCALAFLGVSGVPALAQDVPVDYWPMKLGSTWTMDTTANGKTTPIALTVVKREPSPGGGTDTSVEYRVAGKVTQVEVYRLDTNGFSRIRSGADGSNVITPPFPVLKFPLVFGSSWTWSGNIVMGGHTIEAAADISSFAPETVITPAGNFKAIRIHLELTVDPKGGKLLVTNDYWFAPSVGMVQQTTKIADTFIHGVMTTYHLEK